MNNVELIDFEYGRTKTYKVRIKTKVRLHLPFYKKKKKLVPQNNAQLSSQFFKWLSIIDGKKIIGLYKSNVQLITIY